MHFRDFGEHLQWVTIISEQQRQGLCRLDSQKKWGVKRRQEETNKRPRKTNKTESEKGKTKTKTNGDPKYGKESTFFKKKIATTGLVFVSNLSSVGKILWTFGTQLDCVWFGQ